jgi:hypothetical protein
MLDRKQIVLLTTALICATALLMSGCASDSIRSGPIGRKVSVVLNYQLSYSSAQMYKELSQNVGGLHITTYFLVIEAPGDPQPIAKIVLESSASTFREIQFKSDARNLAAKIRLEWGDEVKETKPHPINLPISDCTIFLKYFGRMDDHKKYHATELISVVSDIIEK